MKRNNHMPQELLCLGFCENECGCRAEPTKHFSENLNDLLNFVENKEIMCYGAGKYGRIVYSYLKQNNLEPQGFIVSHKQNDNILFGKPIYELGEVSRDTHKCVLVTVSDRFIHEVISTIKENGTFDYFVVNEHIMLEIKGKIISKNIRLQSVVKNKKRCFILGTGPTIKKQDLTKLKNEIVFSCSFCSLLDEYNDINPMFYITPALTNDGENEEYCVEKMHFLSENITSPFIIADYNDYSLIANNGFFAEKKVYYISQPYFKQWDEGNEDIFDLTKDTPCILSSSIMMIKVALYMGFEEIILLGLEHRVVEEQKYNHAYDFDKLKELGYPRLNEIMKVHNAKSESSSFDLNARELFYRGLMRQYHFLNIISKNNSVRIINSTPSSNLREFDYVDYNNIFKNR